LNTVRAVIAFLMAIASGISGLQGISTYYGSGTPSGVALTACGNLSTANGIYYLANSVSSTGTCFNVLANGITVNQNGFTVTYGTGGGSKIAAGYLGVDCSETFWPASFDTSTGACSNSVSGVSQFGNLTVYSDVAGSHITQGSSSLPQDSNAVFCDSYFSGNGYCESGPTVYGITIDISSGNTLALSANYGNNTPPNTTGGGKFYSNTVNNGKTGPICSSVPCRESLQGTSVIFGNAKGTTNAFMIHDDTFLGGPQGAVMVDAVGAFFYNIICQPGTLVTSYTNNFCIYAWGPGATVYNVTIGSNPPGSTLDTRGVSVDLTEWSGTIPSVTGNVHDSTIDVITNADNAEYSGCSIGGVYGVQVDDNGQNTNFYNLTVRGHSNACPSTGLRLTALGIGINSHNNTYTGILDSGASLTPSAEFPVTGVYLDSGNAGNAWTSNNDTFIGDFSSVAIDSNGCGPSYFENSTFGSGTNPTGYVTFSFWNNSAGAAGACTQLYFMDPTFTGLASETSTNMQIGNNTPYDLAKYTIAYSWNGTVTGASSGNPISGAVITVVGATGQTECSVTTASNGTWSCTGPTIPGSLIKFTMANSATATLINTTHNPHMVTISKGGCSTYTNSALNIMAKTTGVAISLGGC